jgi:hypothetical protein
MNSCIHCKRFSCIRIVSLALCCALSGPALGAEADPAAPVAPFINNFTFGLLRIEVPGTDFDALETWSDQTLQKLTMTDAQNADAAVAGDIPSDHRD